MTLKGKRVVITRPKQQTDRLSEMITQLGGIPHNIPTVEIDSIPINDKVELKNGKNKVVLANAVKVADPQIYLQGIQHFVCEYVKIGGQTTTWNNDKSDFTK